jgi:hypothetical protein
MVFVFDANGVPSVAKTFRVLPVATAGPYGGLTGGPGANLTSDDASAGSAVTGIRVGIDGGVKNLQLVTSAGSLQMRGTPGGNVNNVTLLPGETITTVSGTSGETSVDVQSIAFGTSNGRTFGPYGAPSGHPFSLSAPAGFEISGIRTRSGAVVNAIGISIRPAGAQTGPIVTATPNAAGVIDVAVSGAAGDVNEWISVYNSANNFVAWSYLNGTQSTPAAGLTTATLTFPGLPAGSYTARLMNDGAVVASSGAANIGSASLNGSRPSAGTLRIAVANAPGEASDWVGIYDNARKLIDWSYLNGTQAAPANGLTSATLTFANLPGGQYTAKLVHGGLVIATMANTNV